MLYLRKTDEILEIHVLLMHLSNNILFCICVGFAHSLYQICASSGKKNGYAHCSGAKVQNTKTKLENGLTGIDPMSCREIHCSL